MAHITSRNTRTVLAANSEDFLVIRRGPAGVAIEAHSREDEWESATVGAFDLDALINTLQMLASTLPALDAAPTTDEDREAPVITLHPSPNEGEVRVLVKHPAFGAFGAGLTLPERAASTTDEDPFELAVLYRDQRDDALAMAALWKEAARKLVRDQQPLRYSLRLADRVGDALARRVEEAEKEQDATRESLREANEVVKSLRAEQPRPLTPDAITDEMVKRARRSLKRATACDYSNSTIQGVLTAALTEPPKRPDGAEEIETLIREANLEGEGTASKLADRLASRGVRVVAEEDAR